MQILRIIRRLENIIKHIVHRSQHGVRLLSITIIKYAHIDNEKITVMKLEHLISKVFGSLNNSYYFLLLTRMSNWALIDYRRKNFRINISISGRAIMYHDLCK